MLKSVLLGSRGAANDYLFFDEFIWNWQDGRMWNVYDRYDAVANCIYLAVRPAESCRSPGVIGRVCEKIEQIVK